MADNNARDQLIHLRRSTRREQRSSQVPGQSFAGKLQAAAGKLVDSTAQHVIGIKLQLEGKAQKSRGDTKKLVKDTRQAIFDLILLQSLARQCPG